MAKIERGEEVAGAVRRLRSRGVSRPEDALGHDEKVCRLTGPGKCRRHQDLADAGLPSRGDKSIAIGNALPQQKPELEAVGRCHVGARQQVLADCRNDVVGHVGTGSIAGDRVAKIASRRISPLDGIDQRRDRGRPTMELTGGALARLEAITPAGCAARIDVSLTDEGPTAQAIVIISAAPADRE